MAERPVLPDIPLTLPGTPRGDLEALRDRLVAEIERSDGSAVASLAKQLTEVLGKLQSIPTAEEKSSVDDLSKRRAARRASVQKRPAGGVERGAGGRRPSS